MNEKNETINQEEELQKENKPELHEEQPVAEETFAEQESEAVNVENPQEEKSKEIEELQKKLEEADNRYLRLQADFDNFRRRTRLEMEANNKYRAQKLIEDLLPSLDNFERAMQMEADHEQTKALLQGMDMVYRSILEALKREGLEPIQALEQEFDPRLHHAVMQAEDENYGSNIVVDVFQKGYMLKDRVIRPAMVKVNQ